MATGVRVKLDRAQWDRRVRVYDGQGVVVGIGHDGGYHEQVLADTRGGVEDVGVPTEVLDIALLIGD